MWVWSLDQTWRRWQPTPVFLPGEFHGPRSLVGYSLWDHEESDIAYWLNNNMEIRGDHFTLSKGLEFWEYRVCLGYQKSFSFSSWNGTQEVEGTWRGFCRCQARSLGFNMTPLGSHGLNLGLLQWKNMSLTTGPPGKSLNYCFVTASPLFLHSFTSLVRNCLILLLELNGVLGD